VLVYLFVFVLVLLFERRRTSPPVHL
jgi:hypothetical protein